MALSRPQKALQIEELQRHMQRASSIMFTHYIGLSVADISLLRKTLRKTNAEMKVAKKTLLRLAAKARNIPMPGEEELPGPIALVLSFGDPLSGAQETWKFGKDHPQVALIGGIFEGQLLSKEEVIILAKLPNRTILLATFLGMLQKPLITFASLAPSTLSSFARALQERGKKLPAPPVS